MTSSSSSGRGLDAGDGGFVQESIAQVEQAQGDSSGPGGAPASFACFDSLLGPTGVAQVIGGDVDQGHDFLVSEMGKPLPQDRDNDLEQVGAWLQDPISGIEDVGFGQHRQGEQTDQRIKPWLLAELVQAEPVHIVKERLQLTWQLARAKLEPTVGHLRVQLGKSESSGLPAGA
ncbi:hypothetical protein [Vulcanococcus sp. Clear-D1]|uniref:hypothetical protein n=1 Tax=Vulcanococcus sp. Clear-D1 TaxID=2766970 RepID=UPI0019B6B3F6|nr:hypothetical protein [Vulcanococcus sp. Clear-D1]MBD1194995.1 hypothetical protein [Vulcanococcus sp. Clear-D1]